MLFTITNGGLQNGRPTSIGPNTISISNREEYAYSLADFTTGTNPQYSDPEGDALSYIEILSLPSQGELKLNGVAVSVGDQVTAGNLTTSNFTFTAPDTDSAGTYVWQFDCADIGSNSISGLTTGNMSMVASSVVNLPPDSVGDRVIPPIDFGDPYTFTSADFTSLTTPAYNDPEGDLPAAIKILDLPNRGVLNYNGSPITVGQVVTVSEIDSGYLVWVPNIIAVNTGYSTAFNFSVSDAGSGQFTE